MLEHERVEALKQVTPNLAYPLWAMLCEHLDTADLLELGMLDSLLVFASNWAKIDQFKFNAVIDHMCARFDFDVLVKHRLPHRMFLIVERAQFKVPLDCIKEGEESSTAAATTTTTTTSSTSQSTPVVPPIATSSSSSSTPRFKLQSRLPSVSALKQQASKLRSVNGDKKVSFFRINQKNKYSMYH